MAEILPADANPEKRLFISLLTRDISLVAAFLDLVDNSINAVLEPMADRLKTAEDYQSVLEDPAITPTVDIKLSIDAKKISINDTAGGISAATAQSHVFKFGRSILEEKDSDRLSVYGLGLKRAIFKLGNRIKIISDHVEGGFELDLDVEKWSLIEGTPWTFDIKTRPAVSAGDCGTKISVTELYDDTKRRIEDGVFEGELRSAISKTYAYFLEKFVNIFVNSKKVDGVNFHIGSNYTSYQFLSNEVTCAITAGIGIAENGGFRSSAAGWFVFCNGRNVISADQTGLTGWGKGLPTFQPKHRPFVGSVFFVSTNAEKLPWTTTKAGINEDSVLWQEAKRHMVSTGRAIINFLDKRYSDEGTEVASKELRIAAGASVGALQSSSKVGQTFEAPKPKTAKPTVMKIQYDALVSQVDQIKGYLRKPSATGAQIGRITFSHFLKNEVGED